MKTWLVTGASRGLGYAFVEAALARGDRVVATARTTEPLDRLAAEHDGLIVMPLDVTDEDQVRRTVVAAVEEVGVLDVVVNNAAAGEQGLAVEELSSASLRATMEVGFFGAVAVTRAVLPFLRAQGHGHVVQMSSMGGLVGLPLAGGYIASKWALEGITESLAQEVRALGLFVTLVEPTAFATGQDHAPTGDVEWLEAYRPLREAADGRTGPPPGEPADAARMLLGVVDAEEPPLRVILGVGGTQFVRQVYGERLAGWDSAAGLLA